MTTLQMESNIDEEWETFMDNPISANISSNSYLNESSCNQDSNNKLILECPKAGNIYISTKSKIAYLTKEINLSNVFWKLPIMRYVEQKNGIVKKQMKFNSNTPEEVDIINNHIQNEHYTTTHVMVSINEPSGKTNWFKDVRKITVGISKKDITSYRSKKKCAFYNCFVIILRIKMEDDNETEYGSYREFHVKIFNTGKLEIPGIQSKYHLETVLNHILIYLKPIVGDDISYQGECETVLINSNFNCGFYIHREILFDILKTKYNIQCIYDPCSYPGIQCKFYYDKKKEVQNGMRDHTESIEKNKDIVTVSFMIFRTGSILIVGMCDEEVLEFVYQFLKQLLFNEFAHVHQRIITDDDIQSTKPKKTKLRKKIITFEIN
jgi:hypothetical protein